MAIRKSSSSGIPFGNTAGRPANPNSGQPYFNGETQRLELMTNNGSWENIVQEVPGVSSITGIYSEQANSGTITVYGTNFVTGAFATAIGTNGVQVNATSTVFNSLVQLTATFTGLSNANEPYDIKVTNPSNLFGILPDALYINASPVWQTAAGSLGSFAEQISVSVSATATDSDSTITYSLASGSTLPSGISLNSSTGLISGTHSDIAADTTYNFTINASDGLNIIPRTFSFIFNAAPIWSTESGSLGTFNEGQSINLSIAATDVSDSISYSLASGSALPSGITLNSTTGAISGTLPDITSNTTYTFTVNATDGVNIIPRSFSITSKYIINSEYLVVAAGGGSGSDVGGGGGGGGFVSGNTNLVAQNTYSITIGEGSIIDSGTPANGGNSVLSGTGISTITAIGGGAGGKWNDFPGVDGGSGGGASGNYTFNRYTAGGLATQPASASGGFGNNGGRGTSSAAPSYGAGGGGGGAGSAGLDATPGPTPNSITSTGGKGGDGKASSITGTSIYYSAGGPGTNDTGVTAGPGLGGVNINTAGTPNTGAGAGGSQDNAKAGGSGVVVIAYPDTLPALTTITGLTYDQPTRAGYRVYRFTAGSGTITI
jgi:hypothetical protein